MRNGLVAMMLALAGCSSNAPPPLPSAEEQARTSAQLILSGVPRDLGGGVAIGGARSEGRMLTLALTGMTDWRSAYTDEQMAGNMKRAICFQPGVDDVLDAGGSIRLQSRTTAGRDLPPLTITRC